MGSSGWFGARHRVPFLVVALVVASAAWLMAAVGGQTRSLRLVSTPWSPFTNGPGEPRFACDLVDEALRRIDVTAQTTIVAPRELTPALLAGRFDGSAALWKDAERERVLLYSRPYLENRLVLVGRKSSDVTASSLTALAGRKVALVEGYSYGEAVERTDGPSYVRSPTDERSLEMLLDGTVDYMLMDDIVVQYLVEHYPDQAESRLEIGRGALVTRPLHFAVRRSLPDAAAIVDGFNEQLTAMIADRSYHRMLHLEWINVDMDGDGIPELVPESDQAGPTPPGRSYELFRMPGTPQDQHFYLGGNIYRDWASVPDRYKLTGDSRPDPRSATGTIFQFRWGGSLP